MLESSQQSSVNFLMDFVWSELFDDEQIDDATADFVISQLLLLDSEDPKKDIRLFINSPGGSVTAGESDFPAYWASIFHDCAFWSNLARWMLDNR